MTTYYVGSSSRMLITRDVMVKANGIADVSQSSATLTVSGHIYDRNSVAVVGATVLLFRQSDNLFIAQTTSGVGGAYSFNRRTGDTATYYTLAYSTAAGPTQIHGMSNRGLVPA